MELYTPEVILTGLVIIVSLAALILSSFARYRQSKRVQDKTLIVELMTNHEILAAMKDGNHNLISFIDKIREDEYFKNNKGAFSGALDKIMSDIQRDVAGLIGMIVTIVLMIMTVSNAIHNVPEQIFSGWLLILGYYFGRGARQQHHEQSA